MLNDLSYLTTEPAHLASESPESPDFYCCPDNEEGVTDLVDLFNDHAE